MSSYDDLSFDSSFETGNLDFAVKINHDEYHLYMRSDSNNNGKCNWFNFKIKNKKAKNYIFKIINF